MTVKPILMIGNPALRERSDDVHMRSEWEKLETDRNNTNGAKIIPNLRADFLSNL
ncbi:MAG: hypothetical protein GVY30_00745 [Chloroflexi bacterium]|jgi:hypothetical protein|nr:hypothetical protein [Chloroflexota bacterium]